jgi:hypothetical protein
MSAYDRCPWPLSREGSLSCHSCCDTGPRFFRSHPKDRHIQTPLTSPTHKGMWRVYFNPDPRGPPFSHLLRHTGIWRIYSILDPHGSPFSRLLRHTLGFGGPILTRILMGGKMLENGRHNHLTRVSVLTPITFVDTCT